MPRLPSANAPTPPTSSTATAPPPATSDAGEVMDDDAASTGPPTWSAPAVQGLALFDIPFMLSIQRKILAESDNPTVLMRAISFIYAHFEIFTFRPADRQLLCDCILDQRIFERLFLFWGGSVRQYFVRLLVWRLSRLGVVAQEQNPNLPPDEGIVAIFNLLNVRLEAIRKRHDALEPLDNLTDEDDYFRPKRSTICSTRGVKEAPWTVDELAEPLDEESDAEEDEPQELVRSLPPPPLSASSGASGASVGKKNDLKTVAKVVSWLKGGLGKKQGKNGGGGGGGSGGGGKSTPPPPLPVPDARIDPYLVERSDTIRTRARKESMNSTSLSLSAADDEGSGEGAAQQEWTPAPPLPTTVETGLVPEKDSPGPHTPAAPVLPPGKAGLLSVTPAPFPSPPPPAPIPGAAAKPPTRTKSSRSEKRSSRSMINPAFFSFEFENGGVVTRSDVDPHLASSASASPSSSSAAAAASASFTSVNTTATSDTSFPLPTSPIRPRPGDPPHSAAAAAIISPRVSLRFSKRISILPPAALDLLKEARAGNGVEAVPPIPAKYRQSVEVGYDKRLHPYAVRGLRDYEDALDEWTDWVARLQEEEDEAAVEAGAGSGSGPGAGAGGKGAAAKGPKSFVDVVPRLAVNWPLQQGED
ncbi:hypothetical protein JCM10213_003712 [Rhodosporidiobolus nylandii]